VRASGGVAGKKVDRQAVEEYIRKVEYPPSAVAVQIENGIGLDAGST
jgi:hypothetical protein